MIRIAIVCALISLVTCTEYTCSKNEYKKMENAFYEASKYMNNKVVEENAAIFIGAEGSGKSALINYLIGNQLTSVQSSQFNTVTLTKVDKQSNGPEIDSGLTFPTRWTWGKLDDLVLWDAPGFRHNSTTVEKIINTFYFYQLVKNVNSLKIIIVVDFNDILQSSVEPFVYLLLDNIKKLFGNNLEDYLSKVSVIFTKVPNTVNETTVDMEFINNQLRNKFLSNTDLPEFVRKFVQYLVDNNNNIGLFKKIQQNNTVTVNDDINILPAIKNSASIQRSSLQELRPIVSNSAKICLEMAKPVTAIENIEKFVKELTNQKVNELQILFDNAEEENELRTLKAILIKTENVLHNAEKNKNDLYEKIEILKEIDDSITQQVENRQMVSILKIIEFIVNTLHKELDQRLENSIDAIILSSNDRMQLAISSIDRKLDEIEKKKHNQ